MSLFWNKPGWGLITCVWNTQHFHGNHKYATEASATCSHQQIKTLKLTILPCWCEIFTIVVDQCVTMLILASWHEAQLWLARYCVFFADIYSKTKVLDTLWPDDDAEWKWCIVKVHFSKRQPYDAIKWAASSWRQEISPNWGGARENISRLSAVCKNAEHKTAIGFRGAAAAAAAREFPLSKCQQWSPANQNWQ